MLTTAALIFIITSKVVLGWDYRQAVISQSPIYLLNMSESSVDDRYDGCTEKMANLVKTKYLSEEITANISGFGTAWMTSEGKIPEPEENLNRNHLIAISVYTGRTVYTRFNQDVRSGKLKYKNMKYAWYSLHFLLTEAIQILKKTQQGCKLTYRGTSVRFNESVLHKEIRFGFFASSSLLTEEAEQFGSESCFEIKTCHGAAVEIYSEYSDEKEILIPPYEKFKVTEIKKDDWCKTVFVLKSSGIRSDLNCAVASAESQIYHRCLSLWLTSSYIFIHFSFLY
ncbi:GPI-linked NAD(P)(+)--arginine ADP-ribosyltransferase 1-like [Paramisgurnus dabryanus]|uniref:GPI-linked NAD(P)(+)--arginine ADP-ribosyltransferase 1-like n=1 Tax=Paramisgurnus dabryanus TaxID=90735 RepID=UPI0031F466C8